MERFFVPVNASRPVAERVLVLAPHPDDEVFGCGGLLALLAEAGASIRCVLVSRVAESDDADVRMAESARAAAILGYPAPEGWAYADGALGQAGDLAARIAAAMRAVSPDLVLAPSPWEMHRDHRAVCGAVIRAVGESDWAGRVGFYEVGQPLQPNTLVDITPVRTRKAAAMAVFSSQLRVQAYKRQITALNVYRTYTLPRSVRAAEAFLILSAAEVRAQAGPLQHDPDRLTATLWAAEREVATLRAQAQAQAQAQALPPRTDAQTLEALRAENARLAVQIDDILRSHSWRMMAPVRGVSIALRALVQRLYRRLAAMRAAAERIRRRGVLSVRVALRAWRQRVEARTAVTIVRPVLDDPAARTGRARGRTESRPWATRVRAAAEADPARLPRVGVVALLDPSDQGGVQARVDSLRAQAYPADSLRLVVVDGRVRGDGAQREDDEPPRGVEVVRPPQRGDGEAALARTLNRAVARLSGWADFVLLLEPGARLDDPRSLARLAAMAAQDDDDVALWEARRRPVETARHYDPCTWETVHAVSGGVLVRPRVFRRLGGVHPGLGVRLGVVGVSFRCRAAGYRLRSCPVATVMAEDPAGPGEPQTVAANARLRLRYGTRDQALAGLFRLSRVLSKAEPAVADPLWRQVWRHGPGLILGNLRQGRGRRGRPVFAGDQHELARHPGTRPDCPDVTAEPVREIGPLPADPPLISVITRTTAARGWLLRRAGLSVLNQTWPAVEWIVVEDGGTDSGAAARVVVEDLAAAAGAPDGTVRYEPRPRQGRSAAGNRGLALARGRWCLFLDDDDLLYADHLETLARTLLADPALSAAYALAWTAECRIDPTNKTVTDQAWCVDMHQIQPFRYEILRLNNFLPIQSVLFSRTLFETRGGFHEDLDLLEDWNLWCRYAFGHAFALVPKVTSLYRTPADATVKEQRRDALLSAYEGVRARTDADLARLADAP